MVQLVQLVNAIETIENNQVHQHPAASLGTAPTPLRLQAALHWSIDEWLATSRTARCSCRNSAAFLGPWPDWAAIVTAPSSTAAWLNRPASAEKNPGRGACWSTSVGGSVLWRQADRLGLSARPATPPSWEGCQGHPAAWAWRSSGSWDRWRQWLWPQLTWWSRQQRGRKHGRTWSPGTQSWAENEARVWSWTHSTDMDGAPVLAPDPFGMSHRGR